MSQPQITLPATGQIKTCPNCNVRFARRPKQPPSSWKKRRFCSRHCSAFFYKEERIAQMCAGREIAMQDPARLEHYRQATRAALDAVRPLANLARTRAAIEWCPVEYRAAYRDLIYKKRLGLPAARAMIREQIETDARRQISRVNAQMHAKAAREKAMAY
jgi:hypothetical protein